MRAIRVLLVILLSVPLLMMTAGAYMIDGQDLVSSYLPGTMVPMGIGSGIPSSVGFSMPDIGFPTMMSGGSSFTMPDTDVSDLMGQSGISSIQGCLDHVGSLTSGLADVSDFVTLPW